MMWTNFEIFIKNYHFFLVGNKSFIIYFRIIMIICLLVSHLVEYLNSILLNITEWIFSLEEKITHYFFQFPFRSFYTKMFLYIKVNISHHQNYRNKNGRNIRRIDINSSHYIYALIISTYDTQNLMTHYRSHMMLLESLNLNLYYLDWPCIY